MIETNQKYKDILAAARGANAQVKIEHRFLVEDKIYTEDDVLLGSIQERLFDTLSIGNLMTKIFDFTFLPEVDIPRKSIIDVEFRISYNGEVSDWYPRGRYYVSTRYKMTDGGMRVKAYDASLKAKVVFMPNGEWRSTTALDLYEEICGKLGIYKHAETARLLMTVQRPIYDAPNIGQNGTTMKEILRNIGVLYGKNWTVNEYGELAMVFPYSSAPEYDAADIDVSPTVEIDRLRIWINNTAYIQYPDVSESEWEEMDGYIIEGSSPYVNEENIRFIADELIGTTYTGFTAASVVEDPAMQLGDGLTIDGHELMLADRYIFMGDDTTECSAPYEEETENEYPEVDPITRELAQSEMRTVAQIQTLDDSIQLEVKQRQLSDQAELEAREESENEIKQSLAQLQLSIDGVQSSVMNQLTGSNGEITKLWTQVNQNSNSISVVQSSSTSSGDYINEQKNYMTYSGGVLDIGTSSQNVHSQIKASGFYVVDGNTEVAVVSDKKMSIATGALEVGSGTGAYTKVGRYKWVDEGTNGFSLIYV